MTGAGHVAILRVHLVAHAENRERVKHGPFRLRNAWHEAAHCDRGYGQKAQREIAPELTGHGLPLGKCEAYNRVYDQFYQSR